jgi:hypothetical protein
MGTKQDPSRFDGYGKAEPDEPVFTLIGRDPAAPALIREWVRHHQNAKTDGTQLMEALAVADEMDRWRMERASRPQPPVIETTD